MTRKYTAADVKTFADLLRTDPDISPEKIAGMDMLVKTPGHFGSRTDAATTIFLQHFSLNKRRYTAHLHTATSSKAPV